MLLAERRALIACYEAIPKVVLLDMAASPPELPGGAEGIRWLIARPGDDGRLIIGDARSPLAGTEDLHPLELPPANVLAVWVPSPGAADLVGALTSWWGESGGEQAVPPVVRGGRAELDAVLLARALEQAQGLAQANAGLLRDLAALRETWENLERIPPEIEELMRALRFAPARLIFGSPASANECVVPLANGAGTADLRQRLPMPARGFLGVDLNVADPGQGEGALLVELASLDAGATLARWCLPFSMLCAGWLPLRLERVSALPWRSLELRISALGAPEAAPRLACGPVGLLGEYAFAGPGAEPEAPCGPQMLSLRLWGGLPGMTCREEAMDGSGALPADPVAPVPDGVVAAARLTRELKASFPCFGYLERGRVLLRPLRTRPSAAALTLPPTPGLIAVSCDAVIDDKLCRTRPLGARLVVTPAGHGADEAESCEGALAASDWVDLDEPLQPHKLVARLSLPHNRPVDLHLFTRLPTGGAISHARIVFARFEAEIHAETAWRMAPVFPSDPAAVLQGAIRLRREA